METVSHFRFDHKEYHFFLLTGRKIEWKRHVPIHCIKCCNTLPINGEKNRMETTGHYPP